MGGGFDSDWGLAGVLLVSDGDAPGRSAHRMAVAVAILVGLCLVVNCYWVWFVGAEQTLYSWDHVAYWSMTSGLADHLFEQPLASLRAVAHSIAESELNLLPSLPLAPFLALAGDSRVAWILVVTNVYALPSLLLGWWALRRILDSNPGNERSGRSWSSGPAWLITVLWFIPLWEPVGLGYLGIGGLGLAFMIYGLVFGQPAQSRRDNDLRSLGVGVALAVLLLFRRWYAFWALGFCITLALETGLRLWQVRRQREMRREVVRNPFIMVCSLAATLVILAAPRLLTMLKTDYSGRFVHYDFLGSVTAEIANIVSRFGAIPLLLVVVFGAVASRSRGLGKPVLLIAVHVVITGLMFRQVQDPSPQHWYLVIPGLLLILAMGLSVLSPRGRIRWVVALGAVVSAAGVLGFGPGFPAPFGSSVRIAPVVRNDLPEVDRLLRFLDGRVEVGAQWIYVLSGTGVVSGSGLGFSEWSLGVDYRSCSRVLQTDQVDLRDGFPDGLLRADVVVVPEPIQVRGNGTTQRVVGFPAEDFLAHEGIARAFARLPETFSLDGGVVVHVFERIRATTTEEAGLLSDRLREHYPEHPFVYSPGGESAP